MALSTTIRLQKYLASCGVASRRRAEELIRSGRVCVDGVRVTEMGIQIDPDRQRVTCDRKEVKPQGASHLYILLNKPKGYVTTMSDPQGRPVVTSLLKTVKTRVFPVGRLDLDTEGALLLTNDGDLTYRVLHPKFETTKTYEAQVKGNPSRSSINKLEKGIMLEGRKTSPAVVAFLRKTENGALLRITIHEGRKRQVRKMFQAIGNPVLHLKRTAYGQLRLGSLKTGSYRFLRPDELKKIFL